MRKCRERERERERNFLLLHLTPCPVLVWHRVSVNQNERRARVYVHGLHARWLDEKTDKTGLSAERDTEFLFLLNKICVIVSLVILKYIGSAYIHLKYALKIRYYTATKYF